MSMLLIRARVLVFALTYTVVGCDTQGPPEAEVAGTYQAETFVVTETGPPVDVLAAGGRLDLTLRSDGTFSSRLVVPGSLTENGQSLDALFDGTFAVSGPDVRFFHGEDFFLRDVSWTYSGGRLRTDDRLPGGTGLAIELARR